MQVGSISELFAQISRARENYADLLRRVELQKAELVSAQQQRADQLYQIQTLRNELPEEKRLSYRLQLMIKSTTLELQHLESNVLVPIRNQHALLVEELESVRSQLSDLRSEIAAFTARIQKTPFTCDYIERDKQLDLHSMRQSTSLWSDRILVVKKLTDENRNVDCEIAAATKQLDALCHEQADLSAQEAAVVADEQDSDLRKALESALVERNYLVELNKSHGQEVVKLRKRLADGERERNLIETDLQVCKRQEQSLKRRK